MWNYISFDLIIFSKFEFLLDSFEKQNKIVYHSKKISDFSALQSLT